MTKTFFIIFISLLIVGGCVSIESGKKIKTFEQTLGTDNSQALTDYVTAFEIEILKEKYPSLPTSKAYSKLLSEAPKSIVDMELYSLFTNYNLENYFKSQLWHEIYAPVDSIWFENSKYRVRYVYLSENGKKTVSESGSSFRNSMDKDSIIQDELGVCSFNRQGKYFQAIESSKSGIRFLEEFYHTKDAVGEISIALFAEMVNRHDLDLNNYLVRRIVAVELGKFINDARVPKKNTFANKSYN